jgi:hypothetical protein
VTSRKFRVVIQGFDPSAGFVPEGPRVGFWTTRYVEAVSESEAAGTAVDLVLADEGLARTVNAAWHGRPIVRADKVEELATFDGISDPGAGYTFFEESDEAQ